METTDNGWTASRTLRTRPLIVAGESFSPGVRDDDDVWEVLRHVAEQMHARVERIWAPGWHEADDWGFSYRPNANNPRGLSRHSAGIAIDYNATRHPNGVPTSRTFTAAQVREVHRILEEVDHVVRWGGDYRGTPDAMHFEIDVPPGSPALARVAARIRQQEDDMPYTPQELEDIIRDAVRAEVTPLRAQLTRRNAAWLKRFKALRRKINEGNADLTEIGDTLDELVEEMQDPQS